MDKQREAFEKWCTKDGLYGPLQKDQYGNYVENTAQCCWQAWQAAQQAQWLPIETAPRDGTEVVVITDIGEYFVAYFGTATKKWHEVFADRTINESATHWMPLPPEPKK